MIFFSRFLHKKPTCLNVLFDSNSGNLKKKIQAAWNTDVNLPFYAEFTLLVFSKNNVPK